MKSIAFAIASGLALLAPAASADAPSYRYAELDYQVGGSFDPGLEITTSGYRVAGSFDFGDAFFVDASYAKIAIDPDLTGDGFKRQDVYFGWHDDHLYAKLGYVSADEPFGTSGSGVGFELGIRAMVDEQLELRGHVGKGDAGDYGSYTAYGFGAAYALDGGFAVTLDYARDTISDFALSPGFNVTTDGYSVGLRFSF